MHGNGEVPLHDRHSCRGVGAQQPTTTLSRLVKLRVCQGSHGVWEGPESCTVDAGQIITVQGMVDVEALTPPTT